MTDLHATLRAAVRVAITNAYYDARDAGETMEVAADNAADAVIAALRHEWRVATEQDVTKAIHDWNATHRDDGCVHFDKGFGPYAACEDPDNDVPNRAVHAILAGL